MKLGVFTVLYRDLPFEREGGSSRTWETGPQLRLAQPRFEAIAPEL